MHWSMKPEMEALLSRAAPHQRAQLLEIPYYLHLWLEPYGGIRGRRVLDFGCGKGFATAGVALLHDPASILGVDIGGEFAECLSVFREHQELPRLPLCLAYEQISLGEICSQEGFDVIFSWSVFEHVGNRLYPAILAELVRKLNPGGLLFLQIAPLFFSPEGGHLWELGYTRWEHLTYQLSDVYADIMSRENVIPEQKYATWSMFMTLNRVTADDLVDRFTKAGLVLLREQRDVVQIVPPLELLNTYQDKVLRNNQIVALFQKPHDR